MIEDDEPAPRAGELFAAPARQPARRDEPVQAIARDSAANGTGSGPPPDGAFSPGAADRPDARSPRASFDSDDPVATVAAIFDRHHAEVLRAAYRITGSAMDAEDVLQTVFTRLLRQPAGPGGARLDLSRSAGGYLHRAAVNAALDLLRSRRRSRLVGLDDLEQEPVDRSGPDPERRLGSRELGRRLRTALSRLSPRQAEVFALRYLEGMGNLEIARLLGSSQTAIAVLLHRARHRLQRELQVPQPQGELS
jgi:RNA polymerase sigma-70 factor, ECF subfamily